MKNWLGVVIAGLAFPAMSQTVGTLPGELTIDKGVAYYQIPINAPAGKGGVSPDLTISYSSSSGSRSTISSGFNISGVSSIERCSDSYPIDRKKSAISYSSMDNYCLNGSRLIVTSGVSGKDLSTYTPFLDDQSQLTLHGNTETATSYFVRRDKSGGVRKYGYNPILKNWQMVSEQSHPNSELVSYIYDDFGNITSVKYDIIELEFLYEERVNRAPLKHYKIDGIDRKSKIQLNRINVLVNNKIKNFYQLEYHQPLTPSAVNFDFLESIKYCDASNSCLPETKFEWSDISLPNSGNKFFAQTVAKVDFSHWGSLQVPKKWGNAPRSWWVDIDGNGLGDFCKTDTHGITCHIDISNPKGVQTYAIDVWGGEKSHWWLDIDNDGRTEFCRIHTEQLICDSFNSDSTSISKVWPLANPGMEDYRWWQDMTGNGIPEYCRRIGDELDCIEPSESGEFKVTTRIKGIEWGLPDETYWVDVNGDANADLCSLRGKTVKCTLISGTQVLQKNAKFAISSVGKPDSRWWNDVNNDGASDLCRLTDNDAGQRVNLTCSLGTVGDLQSFSDDITLVKGKDWNGELGSSDKRWWIDINQDGVTDFCRGIDNRIDCVNIYKQKYSFDVESWGASFNAFMDLNQDGVVELCKKISNHVECQSAPKSNNPTLMLTKVTNGLGHSSSVWFGPYHLNTPESTFIADSSGLHNLPPSFPVAYRMETDNGVNSNNYLYHYGPAKRSPDGIQENGFAWIRQRTFVGSDNVSNQEIQYYTKFPNSGALKNLVNYAGNDHKLNDSCISCQEKSFWNFRQLKKRFSSEEIYQTLSHTHQAKKPVTNKTLVSNNTDEIIKEYRVIEYKGKKYAAGEDLFVPISGSPLIPIILPSKEYKLVHELSTDIVSGSSIWTLESISSELNDELIKNNPIEKTEKALTSSQYYEISKRDEDIISNTYSSYVSRKIDTQYSENGDVLSTVTVDHLNVDSFLNVGKVVTTTKGVNPTTGFEDTYVEVTENTFTNNTDSWIIGLLDATKTTFIHPDGDKVTQDATFSYDSVTGLLVRHTTFPGTSFEVITEKIRDTNGIVIKENKTSTNGSNLETRTSEFNHSYANNLVTTEVVNTLGHRHFQTVDVLTGTITKTDFNGLQAITKLDGFGREVEILVNNSSVNSKISRLISSDNRCMFEVIGSVYCIINESKGSGKKISFYDFLEREVRRASLSIDGKWVFVDSKYDQFGNLTSVTKPYFQGDVPQYIVTKYDEIGRVLSINEPGPAGKDNSWVTYGYSPFTVTKTDAKGRVSKTYTNALGWEIKKEEPNGGSIFYTYYANGMLKSTIASEGESVHTTYNLQGNKSSIDDPDLGLWTYKYDGFGQLTSFTDAKGQSTTYTYDKLGRKLSEVVENKILTKGKTETSLTRKSWSYDNVDGRTWIGALMKATVDNDMIKNFYYNDLGLLKREEVINQDHVFSRELEYNSYGQLIREIRPEQFVLNYERDSLTGFNTEVWGDISQAQVNYTAEEYNSVIEPLINEALNKAKSYLNDVKELREQQYYYNLRKDEYLSLKEKIISFDGVSENLEFSEKMHAELHTRLLDVYTNEHGEKYFKVSPRTVIIGSGSIIPVVQQPNFHLKIEGNLLREVSLEEWAAIENELVSENQIAFYGDYSKQGSLNIASFDLDRDDPLYDQRIREMFSQLNSLSDEVDRLEYVSDLTESRVQSYLSAAEQLIKLVKQVKLVSQKYQVLADQSKNESHILTNLKENDPNSGRVTYWKLNTLDAEGRTTSEVLGNGLVNNFDYHESNGQLLNVYTTKGNQTIRGIHYSYDRMDNVVSRKDFVNGFHEYYYYDDQDRLTAYHLIGSESVHADNPLFNHKNTVAYSSNGNIKFKSDVGNYIYGDPKHKHAVTKAGESTYAYDANGNMISGAGRSISWTGFNKPYHIENQNGSMSFKYDEDNRRVVKISSNGSKTWYFGKIYERLELASGDVQKKHFVYAGGNLVAVNIDSLKSDGMGNLASVDRQIRYSHYDALKSVDMVTDMWGNIVDKKLYDPWGKVRPFSWRSETSEQIQLSLFNRGFTGHETLDKVDLVHMNGRLYDANIGRFISADVYIQAPDNSQSFNRYSYVLNNPLKYNDPSGHFFRRLGRELKRQWRDLERFVSKYERVIGGAVVAAIVTVYTGGLYAAALAKSGSSYFAAGSMLNAVATGALAGATGGAVGGRIITKTWEGARKGALIGGITGAIGGYNAFRPTKSLLDASSKVALSAAGGCATGEISGGSCAKGAKFAALSQVVMLSYEYMRNVTDRYKYRSCQTPSSQSICRKNIDGELLTDGTRPSKPMWNRKPKQTFFTKKGMAPEASGAHVYSENGLVGRFVNKVSKVHDYFNSDVSRLFGFQGYDQVSGLWLEGSTVYNHLFQAYSFTGMLPAAIFTGGAIAAPYPLYQYSQLGDD